MLHPNFTTNYDHYQGCPLAPIELIQYGDFQCEYCAEAYPVLKWLQDSWGKVNTAVSNTIFFHRSKK
jgi:hypothetical protein